MDVLRKNESLRDRRGSGSIVESRTQTKLVKVFEELGLKSVWSAQDCSD